VCVCVRVCMITCVRACVCISQSRLHGKFMLKYRRERSLNLAVFHARSRLFSFSFPFSLHIHMHPTYWLGYRMLRRSLWVWASIHGLQVCAVGITEDRYEMQARQVKHVREMRGTPEFSGNDKTPLFVQLYPVSTLNVEGRKCSGFVQPSITNCKRSYGPLSV
jgi:hypothetical protein